MAVPEPRYDPTGRLFCYALTTDLWVTGGAISNGGYALRWAGETFAPDLVADGHADTALLELASSVPAGSEGLVLLPYVLSERAPLSDLAGALLGIRSHHTRGHFIRAAVEGVCLQLSTIVDALDGVAPVRTVRATGGAFRSELWRRVLAATLARPLVIQADAGGTALGAAALGWFALGGAPTLPQALAAVGGPDVDDRTPPVPVTPAELDSYRELRARVPQLIGAYAEVAALFTPRGDGPDRPTEPVAGSPAPRGGESPR
jgi:gluconokinase